MEVGAVKQAFNNEVILLKKNLNQAKIQIIHKLTRKAKQLTVKKAPEKLQDKLKRKAESAVKEVLIIKKLKARDIARFTVTHKEDLKKYLNKPQVDNDKACARLLLHKSLQEKYNFIRNRFSNVPIKDLFMSRQERLKLKKEEKEKQKNKKKGKKSNKIVSEEGNWEVEDVGQDVNNTLSLKNDMSNDIEMSDNESEMSDEEFVKSDDSDTSNFDIKDNNDESDIDEQIDSQCDEELGDNENSTDDFSETEGRSVKLSSVVSSENIQESEVANEMLVNKSKEEENKLSKVSDSIKPNRSKKVKDSNKNRNLNEKIQQKKFKKTTEDIVSENKVVDPFFITSTGEHYMSLAEPRQPDEVKEVHKQGNRKLRRAVMFGHELKVKPRNKFDDNNDFRRNNGRFGNVREKSDKSAYSGRNSYNDRTNFSPHDKNADGDNRNSGFNGRQKDFKSKDRKFNDNTSKFSNKDSEKPKDEKLHPSWEAKKRQSGILPFQGKKIVFDES